MANLKYGKIIDGVFSYAPNKVVLDHREIYNPNEETLLKCDYLPIVDERPVKEGFYYVPTGWREIDGKLIRQYEERVVQKTPVIYSKLKIYTVLTQYGYWDKLVEWLNTQEVNGINAYTAFSLAVELNDSNPLFENMLQNAVTALGADEETTKSILAACVAD